MGGWKLVDFLCMPQSPVCPAGCNLPFFNITFYIINHSPVAACSCEDPQSLDPLKPARLSTATTKLPNSPTTDDADDIVVSLSALFQLDFVLHNASDAVVPDSKNESGTTTVECTHDVQLIV